MSLLPTFLTKFNTTKVSSGSTTASTSASTSNIKPTDYKEMGVDFDTGQFTGELVSGNEAVKVWIWKCLKTERFRYAIYSWNYGSELDQYIGRVMEQEYLDTDVRLSIEDALYINPYITLITDYTATQEDDHLLLQIAVNTPWGTAEVTANV